MSMVDPEGRGLPLNMRHVARLLGFSRDNILLGDNVEFETGVGDWTATNATLASDATHAHLGTKACLLTCTGAAEGSMSIPVALHKIAVVPGAQYSASLWSYPGSTLRNVGIDIATFTAAGVFVNFFGGTRTLQSAGVFTQCPAVTFTADPTAAWVQITARLQNAVTPETHWIDTVDIHRIA